MLVDGSVHVAPPARDLHVGLVDEPTVTGCLPVWPGDGGGEWGEALQPPVDGEMVDLDPALAEGFLDVAVGESVPQRQTHCQDDDLGREPEPDES